MKKEMRQALGRAFEAPKPLEKQHFLKVHKGKRYYIGMDEFILLQVGYIRKSTWMRSVTCGMLELEQVTRFSLEGVLLARLGILGIVNFMIFLFCLFLGRMQPDMELLKVLVCLAAPYLATVFLGLWIVRKTGFRESEYVCLGIAVIISACGLLIRLSAKTLLRAEAVKWWELLALVLAVLVIGEFYKGLEKTEAYIWN